MAKKVVNSDIYNITELVNNIGLTYLPNESEDSLAIGMYGYITSLEARRLQTQVQMTGELCNESFPSRARLERNIITYAITSNITSINATPAKMTCYIAIRESDILDLLDPTNNTFTIDRECSFFMGDYEFHLDYDILLKRVIVNTVTPGEEKNAYTASYIIPKDSSGNERINPISNITSMDNMIDAPIIMVIEGDRFIYITGIFSQVTHNVETKKIISTSVIDNKTINFTFDDQLAYFEVHVEDTDNNNRYLTPVLEGANIPEGTVYYCWYQYIDTNLIRIRFANESYMPKLNSNVEVLYKTTKGSEGNFSYNDTLSIDLASSIYGYKNVAGMLVPATDAENGKDRKTKEELKSMIPKEVLARGSYTTLADLNNYFSMLNSDLGRVVVSKKIDNQLERVYYTYFVAKDSNGNIIPSNTLDLKVKMSDLTESEIYDTEAPKYILKSGSCIKLDKNGTGYVEREPLPNYSHKFPVAGTAIGQVNTLRFNAIITDDSFDQYSAMVSIDGNNSVIDKYAEWRPVFIQNHYVLDEYDGQYYKTIENGSVLGPIDASQDFDPLTPGGRHLKDTTIYVKTTKTVLATTEEPIETYTDELTGKYMLFSAGNTYKFSTIYAVPYTQEITVTDIFNEYFTFVKGEVVWADGSITSLGSPVEGQWKFTPAADKLNFTINLYAKLNELAGWEKKDYYIGNNVYYNNAFYKCTVENRDTTWVADHWSLYADKWVPGNTYVIGDKVLVDLQLYECAVAHDDTTWVAEHWNSIAVNWVSGTSYAVDDKVVYESYMYNCTVANSDTIWNPLHWEVYVEPWHNILDSTNVLSNRMYVEGTASARVENIIKGYIALITNITEHEFPTYGDTISYIVRYCTNTLSKSPEVRVNLSKGLEYVPVSGTITYHGSATPVVTEPLITNIIEDYGFIYTNPYALCINGDYLYSSFYMMSINENPYVHYFHTNEAVNAQFIISNISWKRDFLGLDKDKYIMSLKLTQSVQEDLGLIVHPEGSEDDDINVKCIVIFYKNGNPYMYKDLTLLGYDETDYSFVFGDEFTAWDKLDEDNNIMVSGLAAKGQSSKILTYGFMQPNSVCKIFALSTLKNLDGTVDRTDIGQGVVPELNNLDGKCWNLSNEYIVENGITFYENYSEIMGSAATPYNDSVVGEMTSLEGFKITNVPMFGYEYSMNEALVQDAINILNYQKKYLDASLIAMENSYGIDFKLFNTYGKSKLCYIIRDTNQNSQLDDAKEYIDRVNLTFYFRVKLVQSKDSYTLNNITKEVKSYIEDLETIGEIHIPNLVSQIIKDFSEQIKYFEYLGFNDYGPDVQHIYMDSINTADINTPHEFVNINMIFDDETGERIPDINIITSEI